MALQQAYYTSSATGLRGGAGFQINAASPRLDHTTLDHIERYSGYQPPLALAYDRQASPGDFPQALSYYRLSEQVWVVARSIYLGAEGSEQRGGNFFTHSLISLEGKAGFQGFLPIEYWQSPHWQSRAVATTTLPEISAPRPNSVINLAASLKFLQQQPQRLANIGWLLAAGLDSLRGPRRVVIVAPDYECASWIAALTLALPRSIAYELSFSTYTRDPTLRGFHISGLDPREDHSWSRQQALFDWYVMDQRAQVLSPLETSGSFVRFAVAAFNRAKLDALQKFLDWCDTLKTPPDVYSLDALFELYLLGSSANSRDAVLINAANTISGMLDEAPEIIATVLERLLNLDAMQEQTQAAIFALFASSSSASAQNRAQLIDWFSVWVTSNFLPKATLADLRRLEATLARGGFPAGAAPGLIEVIDWRLDMEREPSTIMALLNLAPLLKLDLQQSEGRRVALKRLAQQEKPAAETQLFFAAAFKQRDEQAVQVLITQLASVARSSPLALAGWRDLLSRAEVRESLFLYCAGRPELLPLYLYLRLSAPGSAQSPVQQMAELLSSVARQFGDVNWLSHFTDSFDFLCVQQLFPQETIAPKEAAEVLRFTPPALVSATQLQRKIARGLLREPALEQPEYFQLIGKVFATKPKTVDPSDQRVLFCLKAWHESYDRPMLDQQWQQKINDLLVITPAEFAALRQQVIRLTIEAIALNPETVFWLKELLTLKQPVRAMIWDGLEQWLAERRKKPNSPEWFCAVFTTLTDTHNEHARAIVVFAPVLRPIWNSFSRNEQREIDQWLQENKGTTKHWLVWRSEVEVPLWQRVFKRSQ